MASHCQWLAFLDPGSQAWTTALRTPAHVPGCLLGDSSHDVVKVLYCKPGGNDPTCIDRSDEFLSGSFPNGPTSR